jgi:hypothetical protein
VAEFVHKFELKAAVVACVSEGCAKDFLLWEYRSAAGARGRDIDAGVRSARVEAIDDGEHFAT